jgi:serine protease Do
MKTKNILLLLVIGIVSGIFGSLLFSIINKPSNSVNQEILNRISQKEVDSSNYYHLANNSRNGLYSIFDVDFTKSAELCLPAVVHVKTQFNTPNYTLYDFIFGTHPRSSTPVMSSGSGVIISPDGYIVTNNHVIDNAELIEVVLNDKRSFSAQIVGRDATTDLALLKVESDDLPYISYGNSDELKVGEWVLAIGNPFNLTSTATHGIISAKARNINILTENLAIESFIQTDAAVNPGNSGGALVNLQGELIGINTAIASRTGSFVGYSFAVPVNIVRKVIADIVEFGEVQRSYLGVDILDIDSKIAEELEIESIKGVYIARVRENGAASKAGLKVGDIILKVNDFPVNTTSELMEQISKYRPGNEINIEYKRKKTVDEKRITLQNKYGNTDFIVSKIINSLGASFEPISDIDKESLGIKHGVLVNDVFKGKFSSGGIRKGFIIMYINKTAIDSIEQIEQIVKSNKSRLFIEGVYVNGAIAYYTINM